MISIKQGLSSPKEIMNSSQKYDKNHKMANNIGIKSVTRPFWQDKRMSNAQFVEHLDQFLVKRFVAANGLT